MDMLSDGEETVLWLAAGWSCQARCVLVVIAVRPWPVMSGTRCAENECLRRAADNDHATISNLRGQLQAAKRALRTLHAQGLGGGTEPHRCLVAQLSHLDRLALDWARRSEELDGESQELCRLRVEHAHALKAQEALQAQLASAQAHSRDAQAEAQALQAELERVHARCRDAENSLTGLEHGTSKIMSLEAHVQAVDRVLSSLEAAVGPQLLALRMEMQGYRREQGKEAESRRQKDTQLKHLMQLIRDLEERNAQGVKKLEAAEEERESLSHSRAAATEALREKEAVIEHLDRQCEAYERELKSSRAARGWVVGAGRAHKSHALMVKSGLENRHRKSPREPRSLQAQTSGKAHIPTKPSAAAGHSGVPEGKPPGASTSRDMPSARVVAGVATAATVGSAGKRSVHLDRLEPPVRAVARAGEPDVGKHTHCKMDAAAEMDKENVGRQGGGGAERLADGAGEREGRWRSALTKVKLAAARPTAVRARNALLAKAGRRDGVADGPPAMECGKEGSRSSCSADGTDGAGVHSQQGIGLGLNLGRGSTEGASGSTRPEGQMNVCAVDLLEAAMRLVLVPGPKEDV